MKNNFDEENDESMTEIFKKENITNFKGIYYKEKENQRFFEGKAHFSYKELYKVLELLSATLQSIKPIELPINNINPIKKEIETVSIDVNKNFAPSNQMKVKNPLKNINTENLKGDSIKNIKSENLKLEKEKRTSTSNSKIIQKAKALIKSEVSKEKNLTAVYKNTVKIKSIKYNEKQIKPKEKKINRSNSKIKSHKNSVCSNSSFNNSISNQMIRQPSQNKIKTSFRTVSSEKEGNNKSIISSEKNNVDSSRKSHNKKNSINIENRKIYTTINPNHLKKYNNNNKYSIINTDMVKEVKKLTNDFTYGLLNINQQYIRSYINEANRGNFQIIIKENSNSRDKNIIKYEKMTSKGQNHNKIISRNQSSTNLTKLTSSNSSNSKSIISRKRYNIFDN